MAGENNLDQILKGLKPQLNEGEYIFACVEDPECVKRQDIICEFKEAEGYTLVLERSIADALNLDYEYVAAWITLHIHSSLDAVGLTATFSQELAKYNISCNVIAAYYHDHIFVNTNDALKTIEVLNNLSNNY